MEHVTYHRSRPQLNCAAAAVVGGDYQAVDSVVAVAVADSVVVVVDNVAAAVVLQF